MSLIKDTRKNGDKSKSIKSFFAPKAAKGDSDKAGSSPESTSDYESEPSRCATPMTSENGSHSNSPELKLKNMAPKEEETVFKEDKNGRSIRDKKAVDYSVFLNDKEFANDDKFEEYVAKMEEYRESLSNKSNECNAYLNSLEKQSRGVELQREESNDGHEKVREPSLLDRVSSH